MSLIYINWILNLTLETFEKNHGNEQVLRFISKCFWDYIITILFNGPCNPCHSHPVHSHACIYSSHSGSILLPCYHNNIFYLKYKLKQRFAMYIRLFFLFFLTISSTMTMSFTMDVPFLTLAVVTLAIWALDNAGSSNTMTWVTMSISITKYTRNQTEDHTNNRKYLLNFLLL